MNVMDDLAMRRYQRFLNRQARAQPKPKKKRRKPRWDERKKSYQRWQLDHSTLASYWAQEDEQQTKEMRSNASGTDRKKNEN